MAPLTVAEDSSGAVVSAVLLTTAWFVSAGASLPAASWIGFVPGVYVNVTVSSAVTAVARVRVTVWPLTVTGETVARETGEPLDCTVKSAAAGTEAVSRASS